MAQQSANFLPWSDALGRKLLSSLPDQTLANYWGGQCVDANGDAGSSLAGLRVELLQWARKDGEVGRWITQAWRRSHPEVVAAADHAVTEGLSPNTVRLLEQFGAEAVLLAFLTDEFDDGPQLAHSFMSQVGNDGQRRALAAMFRTIVGDRDADPQRRARIAILGGSPRDRSRLRRRLFESSFFEVRWNTFEKKQGGAAVEKVVVNALRHADAAIIIAGTASHILVQLAKGTAQRLGVAWTCIDKASEKQVTAALDRLFPVRTPAGSCMPFSR